MREAGKTLVGRWGGHGRILRSFSLIELVIVVVIVAILARVAIPRFANSLTLGRVEAAANRIANDLILAQRHARITGAAQRVTFTVGTNSYQLVGLVDRDRPKQTYTVSLADPPYEVTLASVSLGGPVEVQFDGYGVPNRGGTIQVSAGKYRASVTLDAVSGQVTTTSWAIS